MLNNFILNNTSRSFLARVFARAVFAFLVALLCPHGFAFAEDTLAPPTDAVELPHGVPPLPDPSPGDVAGTIVNSFNAADFKSVIIPELLPAVRAGAIEMDSVRAMGVTLDPGSAGKEATAASKASLEDGSLASGTKLARGFPFGDPRALENETDKKIAGQKALWDIASNFWGQKVIDAGFEFQFVGQDRPQRTLGGRLTRIYPTILNADDKSIQLWREKLTIFFPSALNPYTWLTFRFLTGEEDIFWLYSPAVSKVRQLTGSNRSDSIVLSGVSPDDIFGWSGKAEWVEANLDRKMVALVPFAGADFAPKSRKLSDGCELLYEQSRSTNGRPILRWNYESKRFPRGAAWLPTSAVWVPRPLYRIELSPKDPYSRYGLQVLYVDQRLMLPYVKIVYDTAGKLLKQEITTFAYSTVSDDSRRVPFAPYSIIDDRSTNRSFILNTLRVVNCEQPTDELRLTNFDPKKIVPELAQANGKK